MPKKLEKMRKAIQKTGKSKGSSYAIATAAYNKSKGKKKSKK